jgi:hypothetical protein
MPRRDPYYLITTVNQKPVYGGPAHGTRYSLKNACRHCGTGAERKGPFITTPFKLGRTTSVYSTYDDELLVAEDLARLLQRAGIECLEEVQNVRNGSLLDVKLLSSEGALPRFSKGTTGYELEDQCPHCRRDGHFNIPHEPLRLVYGRVPDRLLSKDVLTTYECFGNSRLRDPLTDSHFASPCHVVSDRLRALLQEHGGRGLEFTPVDIAAARKEPAVVRPKAQKKSASSPKSAAASGRRRRAAPKQKPRPIDRERWRALWNAMRETCVRLGGGAKPPKIEKPATPREVAAIEKKLGRSLPSSMKTVFTAFSKGVFLDWHLPEKSLPSPFEGALWGTCHWGLKLLPQLEKDRREWVKTCFGDADDEYNSVWHTSLAFLAVANGDMVAIDLADSSDGPVVYLSHEQGEGHGVVLGLNYADFIDRWSRIGCVGPEDWLLMRFVSSSGELLDPGAKAALKWRQLLHLPQ